MTLYRARPRHARRPVHRAARLRADDDGGLLVARRRDHRPRRLRRGARRASRRRRSSTCAAAAAARAGRHPRPLPAGAGHRRARHAAAGVARPVRPAGGGAPGRPSYAARWRASSSPGWSPPAPRPRWCSASHFAPAVDACSPRPSASACGSPAGLVVSDRGAAARRCSPRPSGPTTRRSALAARWHGKGRARYAVTPRFSYSAGDAVLDACARRAQRGRRRRGSPRTSTRTRRGGRGRAAVRRRRALRRHLRPARPAGRRAVLAHNVHPTDAELGVLAARGTAVAHCPTSNSALGSGLFPLRRHSSTASAWRSARDVGAGTGFSLFKEGLQAYFVQQLLGDDGLPLTPRPPAPPRQPRGGGRRWASATRCGDLSVGKQFDAIGCARWSAPRSTSGCATPTRPRRPSAKVFALGR